MAASTNRPGEMIVGINVTPMVDIVLVLLIVLMVAASYTVSRAVPLDLPRAQSGEQSKNGPLTISIDKGGTLFLEGQEVSPQELREAVRRSKSDPSLSALIAADGAAAHRHVVGVIDLLRTEGIHRFAINVAPEELPR